MRLCIYIYSFIEIYKIILPTSKLSVFNKFNGDSILIIQSFMKKIIHLSFEMDNSYYY